MDDSCPNPFAQTPHHACVCGHSWDIHMQVMTSADVAYHCQAEWPHGKGIGRRLVCACQEYRPNRFTPVELSCDESRDD